MTTLGGNETRRDKTIKAWLKKIILNPTDITSGLA